jgi:hypothetical protein
MATMTESSADKRVDDLRSEMHRGFDQVGQRFEQVDQRFEQVDQRFEQVEQRFRLVDHRFDRVEADIRELRSDMKAGFEVLGGRFDSLQRLMIGFFATTLGSAIAGVFVLLVSHS